MAWADAPSAQEWAERQEATHQVAMQAAREPVRAGAKLATAVQPQLAEQAVAKAQAWK